ncbi:MAG: cysteine desulfurase family protein, partial [Coriobacteriales bacterium]
GHIICSEFEHKAVLQTVLHMKSLGYDVSMVSPRADGFVHPDDLEELIRPDTLLVSIMTANNEIGTVQPISELAEVCHDHSVIFHTDAVAAVGKMRFDIRRLGVDSASFTAHKICGPKGIGALYLNKRHPFTPLVNGGGQERGRRSGTSDVPGAVGFAKAVELAIGDDLDDVLASFAKRRDRLIGRLLGSGLPIYTPVEIPTGDTEHHLPQLVPLLVDGMESEEMVRLLDERGFSVSGGSACTTGQAQTSHVLRSIGCDDRLASGFLRVTFGRFTTDEELDAFADALCEIVSGGISGRRQ